MSGECADDPSGETSSTLSFPNFGEEKSTSTACAATNLCRWPCCHLLPCSPSLGPSQYAVTTGDQPPSVCDN